MKILEEQMEAGNGMIFETEGIDFNEQDDIDLDEQNLDDEAQRMMLSWDRKNLLQEVDEGMENQKKESDDYAFHYDGTKSFDELKKDMVPCDGNFVYTKILEERPNGKQIFASHTVLFDRIGFFEFNPIPFESSIHDGRPNVVNLGIGPIIPGLVQALMVMRQGERANILIHPALAYGRMGCPPLIPKDSYLFYTVKIHKVWDEGDFDGMLQYERSMHLLVPLQDKIDLAKEQKDIANQYLLDDQPKEALVRYKAAIKWLTDTPEEDRERSPECRQLMNVLWQNTAITLNKLGSHKSASKAAKQALNVDPRNIKALFALAKARMALGDNDRALQVLERAKIIAPGNPCITYLKSRIDIHLRDEKKKRVEIMRKMSKACV